MQKMALRETVPRSSKPLYDRYGPRQPADSGQRYLLSTNRIETQYSAIAIHHDSSLILQETSLTSSL